MRLLGCHIANFGCFHDYDLTFDEGLNVIMQANGWGKSTLAAFVKAMLYGFGRKRVRDVSENERLRFKPWQGGAYGGSLDFEVDGRELRVLRTFGATAAKDTLKLVDLATGRSVLSEVEGDVGEWLFGLDANAFQKSVYVVQNGFGFDGSMAGLRNRMNALINEADDVAGFDKAQARLEERRKYYRRTGNRGAIADASREVAKLVEVSRQDETRVATLRQLQGQIESCDKAIAELDAQIAEGQKAAESQQAREQERAALRKVAQQLEERRAGAQKAYDDAIAELGGHVPSEDEIERVQSLLDESTRAEAAVTEARTAAKAAESRRRSLHESYPHGLPTQADLRKVRGQLSKLAELDAALVGEGESAGEVETTASLDKDPRLVSQAADVTKGYKRSAAALRECREAREQADALRRDWDAQRQQVASLRAEVAELKAALPDDAVEVAEGLRTDARMLRAADMERGQALRQLDERHAQLDEARSRIAELPEGTRDESDAVDQLGTAAALVRDTLESANEARRESSAADERADAARLALDDARRALDDQRAAIGRAASQPPVAAIACLVAGVAAFVVGVVLGPVGTVSFMLYGVGAVLAALGLMLWRKGPSKEDVATEQSLAEALSAAEREYASARDQARDAAQKASEASRTAEEARTALVGLAEEVFPGETFNDETIEAQVPVLTQRLDSRRERRLQVEALERAVDEDRQKLDEVERRITAALDAHDMRDLSADLPHAADLLEAKERELSSGIALVEDRSRRLDESYHRLVAESYDPSEVGFGDTDIDAALQRLQPARIDRLEDGARRSQDEVDRFMLRLNDALATFELDGVTEDHMAVGVERLGAALVAYRDSQSRREAKQREHAALQKERSSLQLAVGAWAKRQGLSDASDLTEEWFAHAEEAMALQERIGWELRKAQDEADKAEVARKQLLYQLNDACDVLGIPRGADVASALKGLQDKVRQIDGLRRGVELAEDEQRTWREQHQDALDATALLAAADEGASERLALLTRQRDEFVRERAHGEEQQSAILASLERVPAVQQELALLSKKKQLATANLFTIQKTAEYLQRARDGLDGRYLGDLGDRFGDYANAWLHEDQVDAVVDGEFGVALYEDGAAHDVAGYSTGYQDLLDVCFRMAIVDTIFQAEPPFLVMDDPFANLDEEKLARALQLLGTLAQKYQIIYFTCHPSRMETGDEMGVRAAFTLPEQRERRELPRARARREAQERAEAQAKLVASYEVVPVAKGKASIRLASNRRSISNNLFSLAFEVDDEYGMRDNSFEVHFIDERGRVLCDRQTVEVIDGHVVPERVRFSLSTRDDSGSTYELIVHEDGREPAQLAARIPFAAEVSFAADDFGF